MSNHRLLMFLLSILTAMSTFFGTFVSTGNPIQKDDGFVPVLRFAATSDTHVNFLNDKQCARITKMIKSAYSIADSDDDYNKLDAVVFSGDLTNAGTPSQFMAFTSTVKSNIMQDTEFMACVAKNHDGGTMGKASLDYFTNLTGMPTDFHKVINGYHFIGLSTSPIADVHYSEQQIKWLDEQLSAAASDAPEQPIFVFQHEHIYNTVYGSYPEDGWGIEYLTDTLSKYPQVVDISGHSHYPANDPRAVWQGAFTAINDGGLAYFEFTVDGKNCVHPRKNATMAQALIVEVDAQNRVLVRVYDVTAEKYVYEYLLDNISDTDKSSSSNEKKADNAAAPVFSQKTEIQVKKFLKNYTFSVKQAVPDTDDIVFLYRLTVKNSEGETVKSAAKLSEYYFANPPQDVEFDSVILTKGTYTVEVVAEDAWGKLSVPIKTEITVK